ncbi:MAG: type II toxin-antitoxin system HicB family antitoxin [Bacteroidales bacterium]|nr:type II toxin-antitoxin system HicB family antitoxin [Bacteroidales bacterium]
MEYTIIIEKNPESGWYVGQCMQLPEAISQGETLAELMDNMKDAIELVVEYKKDDMKKRYLNRKVFYRKLTVKA